MPASRIVLFVHGWSVTHTDTYGSLPQRLKSEARSNAQLNIDVRNLYLSRYISFHDEVRMPDLARAFEEAIRRELAPELDAGRRLLEQLAWDWRSTPLGLARSYIMPPPV